MVKKPPWQCRRHGFHPGSGKIPATAEQLSSASLGPGARTATAEAGVPQSPCSATGDPCSSEDPAQLKGDIIFFKGAQPRAAPGQDGEGLETDRAAPPGEQIPGPEPSQELPRELVQARWASERATGRHHGAGRGALLRVHVGVAEWGTPSQGTLLLGNTPGAELSHA